MTTSQATASLARIMDSITDPIFMKDAQSRFVLVNDAMCVLMGQSREELLGRQGLDLVPPEQAAVFLEKDAIVLRTRQENINEELFTTTTGTCVLF